MILTVTLNPCIDKSSHVEVIRPESKLRCAEVVNEPGGGGINVSKALNRLDVSSVALFPAGGHNGNMLCALLRKENIIFHSIDTGVETRENWIVLETSTNRQYRFTFPGSAVHEATVQILVDQIRTFRPSFVIASGSLPPGLPDSFYGRVIESATRVGARCIVDTSGPALKAIQGRGAYMIKPNIGELARMLGLEWIEMAEVADAAHRAVLDGFAEIVVVSMGTDGAWLVSRDARYFVPTPSVPKKSTVGAGDSMVAGIASSLQQDMTLQQAIRFGVACGSAATMNDGTQLFSRADAETLYAALNG